MADAISPDKTKSQSQPESSSSSSGRSSQSQQSTGPSSLDSGSTGATQDVVDGEYPSEDEDENRTWGKLYPVGSRCFKMLELEKEEYTFGRDMNNDVCFDARSFKKHPHFQAFSKVHFKIIREVKGDKTDIFIQDCSSNGTFVSGEKIGKGNVHPLQNGDEISLSTKRNKAYVFYDCGQSAEEQEKLPDEMKERYTLSRVIGRGAFGEVRLAFEKGSCNRFAVKIISRKNFSVGPIAQTDITREVNILKNLQHPCIIAIKDVYETQDMLYIILELVEGGELFDRVVSIKRFDEQTAKLIFYQLLEAVNYLHERGVTHRDLKPENVLLVSENSNTTLIKVTDFGMSKFVGEQSVMKTICGTPSYFAPEVLTTSGTGSYTNRIDCWSLGVILYIILAGYPPFSEEISNHTLHEQIKNGIYTFHQQFWGTVSETAKDLVRKLLTVDPNERLSVSDALNHPWIQDEEMKKKARNLMSPDAAMPPPTAPISKKRSAEDDQQDSASAKTPKL